MLGASFVLLMSSFAAPGRPGAPSVPVNPNVILVIVEGLGVPPRPGALDRVAAHGRRFENAYATAAARGAARWSLLTGLRPEKTGVFGETDEVGEATPLHQYFQAKGYFTARVGSVYSGAVEAKLHWDRVEDAPGVLASRRAIEILGERRERPLFLAVGLRAAGRGPVPTAAAQAPAREGATTPALPAIALASLDRFARPGGLRRPRALTLDERKRQAEALAARAVAMEAQLGVLADGLDRSQGWTNTVVVVVGDTGADRGAHGALPRTDVLFDDVLHVPLVVTGPALDHPGVPSSAVVESIDVYPTLLALCGLPPVPGLEGKSLVPLLEDPKAPLKRAAFSAAAREAGEIGRSARTSRYRYNEWPDGSDELYDHDLDPRELKNVVRVPSLAAVRKEMRRLIGSRFEAQAPAKPAEQAAGAAKLNVLFIILDDMGPQIGALGYPVSTPNIDGLAKRGRLFDHAYAQVAICSPSRSSLLTGWRPERTDVWNNLTPLAQHFEGATPLQEHFHSQGYFTARVGKVYETMFARDVHWDFDDVPPLPSAEPAAEPAQEVAQEEDSARSSWWQATNNADGQEPDGARARLAARLMEAHKDRPFFLAVGFGKPHVRWVAPKKYFDLYPPESIVLPDEPEDQLAGVPAIAVKNRPQDMPGVMLLGREPAGMNPDPRFRREATAAYYACVSFVDAQVGSLLETLRRLKLWDRTVVVLLGDHGYHLGEHGGLWRKDTLFEQALRSTLVMAAPQVRDPGRTSKAPVEFLDVYPTLVDLAGLPPVPGLDGASLRPLLEDPNAGWRPAAVSFRKAKAPTFGVSVRTDRYRYTQWPDGSEELYDHLGDPDEVQSLVGDPRAAEALEEMRRLRAGGPS
jgi:uncharacterized sulfatase